MGISTGTIAASVAQNLNLAVPVNILKAMMKPTYENKRPLGEPGSATQW